MIETQYIEIKELRSWFEANRNELFNSLLCVKKNLSFGTSDGKITSGNIAPLFAITSQIQYFLKTSGVTVVSWWYCQHIIAAYLRESIKQGRAVNAENYADFISPLKQIKTDQGKTAFSENDIIQVLQAINKYKDSDSLVKILSQFLSASSSGINQNSNTFIDNSNSGGLLGGNVIPVNNQTSKAGSSGLMFAGLALGALFLMGKSKKRK